MPQEFWSNAIFSVTPTIVVGLIFWFVLRAILRSDRTEREVRAKIEVEERARWSVDEHASDSAAREPASTKPEA